MGDNKKKITYNQLLHRISQNMDLSKKENKKGHNKFGIELSEVRKLHVECILGKNPKKVIEKLNHLSATIDLNKYVNEYNMNLIFFTKNPQILTALITLGVNLNHKTNNQNHEYTDYATPGCNSLIYCIRNLWLETIQLLITNENINEIDDDGFSPAGYLKEAIEEERYNKLKGYSHNGNEKLVEMEKLLLMMTNKGAKIIR